MLTEARQSIDSLTTEKVTLEGSVRALTTDRDGLKSEKTTLTENLGAVTKERDTLKSEKSTLEASVKALTTERDTLKADKKTQDAAVAAELAKHGITAGAIQAPAAGTDTTLAAEGQKLLAEYEAVAKDPKALANLLNDPEKGPKLKKLIL